MMHLLNFKELSGRQIVEIVDKGIEVKRHPERYRSSLDGKTLAMIFQKTSTRTRVSFEVAMTQMGGHAIYMDWRATNFTIADIYDETQYLSRNVDCILARMLRHSDLQVMAKASRVPVINGCDEKYHPTQVIADLITIKEKKGRLDGVKLVYVGVHNNVCNSLIEACTKVGMEITTVTPIFNEPSRDEGLLEEAKRTGLWRSTLNLKEAIKDADFVYTDTWIDMEFFSDPRYAEERERRMKIMMPYQINRENMAESKAWIMHDMPIHRGYEISPDMIEDSRSIIYEQSENRLYSAKAVILKVLGFY
ncbi:ornithine carbamoyltransferase [Candidatus Bathyarchaeota archaeon]|nr:ornithine carbamoyltransferase [Candidatus Bathyarchaeota archaeon]